MASMVERGRPRCVGGPPPLHIAGVFVFVCVCVVVGVGVCVRLLGPSLRRHFFIPKNSSPTQNKFKRAVTAALENVMGKTGRASGHFTGALTILQHAAEAMVHDSCLLATFAWAECVASEAKAEVDTCHL